MSTPDELITKLANENVQRIYDKIGNLEGNDYYRPVDFSDNSGIGNPPSQAELDSILGTPASYKSDMVALLNDTNSGRKFIIFGDQTDWYPSAVYSPVGTVHQVWGDYTTSVDLELLSNGRSSILLSNINQAFDVRVRGDNIFAIQDATYSDGLPFKIERGWSNTAALFEIDGGTGRVGINVEPYGVTPSQPLHVGGNIRAEDVAASGYVQMALNSAGGTTTDFGYYRSGVIRWAIRGNATAETGSNLGTDFQIIAYSDAGSSIHNALFISRQTGYVGFNNNAPTAQVSISQSNSSATLPTISLQQLDLSEEFINFVTTVGGGNPIDTAGIGSYYGKARVAVNGTFKYVPLYNS